MMRKIMMMSLVALVSMGGTLAQRWYSYVTNTTELYDEVGIGLNVWTPMFMREWGCAKLKVNFQNALPPYGCQNPNGDGRQWLN